jgi:hypothetical protein
MPSLHKTISYDRPPVDEWGIYDPEQAGLAAVLERVEARRRATPVPSGEVASMAASMRDASKIAFTQSR